MPIDFLIIGHISHDRIPGGHRLGGTVSYAAVTARRLGLRPAILTRGVSDGLIRSEIPDRPENAVALPGTDLEGVAIHLLPSRVSTTFTNISGADGHRVQVVEAVAEPIHPSDLPEAWAHVPIVLLGPLVRELPSEWATMFPDSLLGVTPQGWMRAWDSAGRVRPCRWEGADEFLHRADAIILSREDVAGDEDYVAELAAKTRLLVVTDGWRPVTLHQAGARYRLLAPEVQEVDSTGAGDVFAAAFMIRLAETHDPLVAARFATVVASLSVEGPGMTAIPDRATVDKWLREHGQGNL